jgi:hypothetical protein
MYATLGLNVSKNNTKTLTDVGYKGEIGLLVQEAFTIWYTGQRNKAVELWAKLLNNPDITPEFKKLTIDNLKNFNYFKTLSFKEMKTK